MVLIAALMTLFLGFLTYDRFGWRIHSRLACDLRMKHAAERTIIYFTQNRFGTLVKLDFQVNNLSLCSFEFRVQFLVLTVIMGIVMSVQSTERSVRNDPPTRALVICTGLFFMIGLPWLVAAGYAVSHDLASLARFLSWTCIVTVLPPIGATVSGKNYEANPLKRQFCSLYGARKERSDRVSVNLDHSFHKLSTFGTSVVALEDSERLFADFALYGEIDKSSQGFKTKQKRKQRWFPVEISNVQQKSGSLASPERRLAGGCILTLHFRKKRCF